LKLVFLALTFDPKVLHWQSRAPKLGFWPSFQGNFDSKVWPNGSGPRTR